MCVLGRGFLRWAAGREGLPLGALRVRSCAARVRHHHGPVLRLRDTLLLHHPQIAHEEAARHRQPGSQGYMPTDIPSCSYIHTYTRTYIHTYIHIHMHTYIHAYIHTHIHAYINTCIHTYVHTYIYTYVHALYLQIYIMHHAPQLFILCMHYASFFTIFKCLLSFFNIKSGAFLIENILSLFNTSRRPIIMN